ncbi:unnamed protein product, partial [Mesorhabditis belari]|uniref:Uncharacterized protein n=1 Tax=Mesorhabditis belari TaxID=2138241 RepID=A0AAF3ES18_9BILA
MELAINENQLSSEGFQYDDYVLTNDKHFEPEPENFELESKETREEEPINICSECAHGIQPTFASIRSNFSTIQPFNIDDPVIGSFYCPNGEICIEEENGTLWTSTFDAPTITLVPVPSCQNDICAVYMLFVVGPRAPGRENTADLISLTDNRSFRAEDMQMSGGFRNIDEFGYVKIRGFGCHRCTRPIQYCMKN